MKLIAHYIFTAGLLLYLEHIFFPQALFFYSSLFVSWFANWVIDTFGHETVNGHPRRTFMTHSIFTAPIFGIFATLVPVFVAIWGLAPTVFSYLPPFDYSFEVLTMIGVVAALSHLFLDSFTEGGIYVIHRHAIAHLSHDTYLGNGLAILAGLVLAWLAIS